MDRCIEGMLVRTYSNKLWNSNFLLLLSLPQHWNRFTNINRKRKQLLRTRQHRTMALRRPPTRLEIKADDIEEYNEVGEKRWYPDPHHHNHRRSALIYLSLFVVYRYPQRMIFCHPNLLAGRIIRNQRLCMTYIKKTDRNKNLENTTKATIHFFCHPSHRA